MSLNLLHKISKIVFNTLILKTVDNYLCRLTILYPSVFILVLDFLIFVILQRLPNVPVIPRIAKYSVPSLTATRHLTTYHISPSKVAYMRYCPISFLNNISFVFVHYILFDQETEDSSEQVRVKAIIVRRDIFVREHKGKYS